MRLILSWHWKYYEILWLSAAYINWLSKGCGLQLCDKVHHMFANSHNALNLPVLLSWQLPSVFFWRMFALNLCGFLYVIWGKRNGSYTLKDIRGNKIAHVNTLEVFLSWIPFHSNYWTNLRTSVNLGAGFIPFDVTAGLCFFFLRLWIVPTWRLWEFWKERHHSHVI